MSIRPVDLQVLITRAKDVGRHRQTADQQLVNQQQQFAEQLQQIAQSRQHKVQSTPKDEGGKVQREKEREEKEERGRQSHQQHQEAMNKEDSQGGHVMTAADDPVRGHLIDIKT